MKTCRTCEVAQPLENFHADKSKADRRSSRCKPCVKAYRAGYYLRNSERLKAYSSQWARDNRDKHDQGCKAWRAANRQRHLENRARYFKRRYHSDVGVCCDYKIRAMLRRVLKAVGKPKDFVTFERIGYSRDQLIQRLEMNFKPGMHWGNFGEWEIDHRLPVSHLISRGELRPEVINCLSNLVPKWRHENRSKGNRYAG